MDDIHFDLMHALTGFDNTLKYRRSQLPEAKPFNFNDDGINNAAGAFLKLESEALSRINAPELESFLKCMSKIDALKVREADCMETITELQDKYNAVTDKTSALHHACDQMMSQQTQMASGTEQLKTNLHYYTQCEWIMKKLQTSRLLVTGSVFAQIISSIHECMEFLKAHPEHRESATYLVRYEQCLSRALTTIKASVLSDIDSAEREVLSRQAAGKGGMPSPQQTSVQSGIAFTDDDTYALLYGVFGVKSTSVRNALSLAHQYFGEHIEYQEMISECEAEYFRIRESLLRSAVERAVEGLVNRYRDSSCTLTRDGCSVLLRLCDDEYRLYKQFFIAANTGGSLVPATPSSVNSNSFWGGNTSSTAPSTPFNEFVESMCRILYDSLRPLIIHNPHLETLAQLCALLKIEMIEERCGSLMSIAYDESDNAFNPRAGFVNVMNELVGDIVERIVYRTSSFGQSDVLGYNPASGDLAYPERLHMMKNIEAETTPSPSGNRKPSTHSTSAIDLHCLWYPTVRRTIVCLSKLYKCLDQSVFMSISRELLDQCAQSLEFAADRMRALPIDPAKASVKGFGRLLDAELFIVKHLLIIREQTSPYRVTAKSLRAMAPPPATPGAPAPRSIPELGDSAMAHFDYSIDFSKYRSSAMTLFSSESRSKWFELSTNNAFLSFLLAAPIQVHELQTDSRRIIENQLKKHCHKLIKFVVNMVVGDLATVSTEIDTFEAAASAASAEAPVSWKQNPKLQPKALNDVVSNVFKNLKQNWPAIRATFTLYIGVRETEEILLQPIRKNVVDYFTNVNLFAQKNFSEEQRQVASIPNQEQIWLLLNA
uniref:Conserved oligomeric Golgi complex subunit 3 n=1 Tax=Panagrellus redivivus TaxID=6233 RepID=A0A7E4W7S3_PANRE